MARITSRWLGFGVAALLVGFAGCDGLVLLFSPETAVPESTPTPPLAMGTDFDPEQGGRIEGAVVWDGPSPVVPPYRARVSPHVQRASSPFQHWPNPNVPAVDRETRGVADAVVFLRGIDPRRGRPWHHAPVHVEQRDYRFRVSQGAESRQVGFVRVGGTAKFSAAPDDFHAVRARGADFFTFAFPRPARPCVRRFHQPGVVELTSAAGYFWMRAYLFVADHPYYALTDAEGRFALGEVPPGDYQLVCWLPSWHEAGRELDAETAGITRLDYRKPLTLIRPVVAKAGGKEAVTFRVSAEDFAPPPGAGR